MQGRDTGRDGRGNEGKQDECPGQSHTALKLVVCMMVMMMTPVQTGPQIVHGIFVQIVVTFVACGWFFGFMMMMMMMIALFDVQMDRRVVLTVRMLQCRGELIKNNLVRLFANIIVVQCIVHVKFIVTRQHVVDVVVIVSSRRLTHW